MINPIVSVACVTYRNLDSTRRFIDSVRRCTQEPYEIVLVDNGSAPDLAAYLNNEAATDPNFKLIRNPSNFGIGIAMNQAMRACTTDYIFRCDTDVEIQTPYWTQLMREIADKNPEVGAVGTKITGGTLIQRGDYMETDICLSNCMLIPRRTIHTIDRKMKIELPRVSKKIIELIGNCRAKYKDYFKHMGLMLDYMYNDGGYWNRGYPYGVDDFDYSMLVRYAGLHIAKDDRVNVHHADDSLRPDWKEERHRRVNEGFQYWRTFWEIMEDFDRIESLDWGCWPMNKKYAEEAKKCGTI